jgi:hypothetical protein
MIKKKVFAARNLKECYQVYHLQQDSKKKKIKVFNFDNFVFPWVLPKRRFLRQTMHVNFQLDSPTPQQKIKVGKKLKHFYSIKIAL